MVNNSQGKTKEVEDHRRNVKSSKNKTSISACNDSLNAKTSNVNFVCATCGKYVLIVKHDVCVLKSLNGVNSRTKMPMAVPVSTREPKRIVNQSVATPLRKTVALESTNQKPGHITRKLYEHVSKACSWWYPKFTPPGYKWKPKSKIRNVNTNLVEIILFIVDSGCSKHMTKNLKLLTNFVEKFLGTVKFRNDQIVPILSYRDLVQGAVTIKRVYYVEGLNHNLFSVGQLCDAELEVAFRKSTCYIRDLKGNDLLTGSRSTDLYFITLQDKSSPNPICLMAKATLSQEWLWHRRLFHLNFDTINFLSKNDIVIGLPKEVANIMQALKDNIKDEENFMDDISPLCSIKDVKQIEDVYVVLQMMKYQRFSSFFASPPHDDHDQDHHETSCKDCLFYLEEGEILLEGSKIDFLRHIKEASRAKNLSWAEVQRIENDTHNFLKNSLLSSIEYEYHVAQVKLAMGDMLDLMNLEYHLLKEVCIPDNNKKTTNCIWSTKQSKHTRMRLLQL
nr:integrase, catalytic region, zinc finger, CCHC-type, peptidase aspartic, catalytic [Tanacetum cinerariifolium]